MDRIKNHILIERPFKRFLRPRQKKTKYNQKPKIPPKGQKKHKNLAKKQKNEQNQKPHFNRTTIQEVFTAPPKSKIQPKGQNPPKSDQKAKK